MILMTNLGEQPCNLNSVNTAETLYHCHSKKRAVRCWHSCPEWLWMPHSWRCSGPGWMGPWATWSSRVLELDDLKDPFQPKPFYDSVILWSGGKQDRHSVPIRTVNSGREWRPLPCHGQCDWACPVRKHLAIDISLLWALLLTLT